jgi:hypothetical protein
MFEGRAVVRDSKGNVRVLVEDGGTGDSAGVYRYFFDSTGKPQVATFSWNNVTGSSTEGIAILDSSGDLLHCEAVPGGYGNFLCENPDFLDQFRAKDPIVAMDKCDTPYSPPQK